MSADANKKERLSAQFAFSTEIDKEKNIFRQTFLADKGRKENDSEHAWHMAIMTYLFAEYANEPIDVLHTIMMLLVHDLVEIDAGDTYAYDPEAAKSQRAREEKAADRIFAILPAEQGKALRDLWEEFEEGETPEAKFAHTMDNLQPMMLNAAADGISWEEHQVHLSQILKRNARTMEGSQIMWDYAKEHFLKPYIENGTIRTDGGEDL